MLYRDGFYEATIMVSRSIAEMICYDHLDRAQHPFGTREQVERKNFRQLIDWLHNNDERITTKVFDKLNDLYDLGNNYVHPKSGQNPKDDSLKALHMIGESVFELYGVKTVAEMVGKTIRTPYTDLPDICSGQNFMLEAFLSPEAAWEDAVHHENPHGQQDGGANPSYQSTVWTIPGLNIRHQEAVERFYGTVMGQPAW
jgi:hypothetical protein